MWEKTVKFAVNISRVLSVYELTASGTFWIIYLFIYLFRYTQENIQLFFQQNAIVFYY
jgi:hypothetical protein